MPGSGIGLLWDESNPADSANAGGGAGAIRSLETSLRNGLAQEHNWPNATGANFGYHLPGSARAFYGVESTVSSSGTDGRLMVSSDRSRLFHVGSGGTMFLGSDRVIEFFGTPGGYPQLCIQVFNSGVALTNSVGLFSAAFSSPYSGIPFSFGATAYTPFQLAICSVGTILASGISGFVVNASASFVSGCSVAWWSIGTRALG